MELMLSNTTVSNAMTYNSHITTDDVASNISCKIYYCFSYRFCIGYNTSIISQHSQQYIVVNLATGIKFNCS